MENYNPFSLKGKTILVTGASSGIGRSIAIECSKMGAKVVITARNKERLNDTFVHLSGDDNIQIIADSNSDQDVIELVNQSPILDGVVFCAGVGMFLPIQFCKRDKYRSVIETNLMSPIDLSYQLLKHKKIAKHSCSFVFISSVAGNLVSYAGSSIYSASKAGMVGLAKGMAIDLAPKKIRVNTIMPGMIETKLVDDLAEVVSQESLEQDKKRYPMNCYGSPEDVANGAIYLLSDASKWVTGTNLLIDGGYTLQ